MNMFLKIPQLKMNQAPNQSGNSANGGKDDQSKGAPQFTPPKEGGSGNNKPGAPEGQQSQEAGKDPYSSAGDPAPEDNSLGPYGADGELKEKPAPKHEAVDLKYKLDVDGLSDEEATQIKEFAKANKLSKEQADAFVKTFKAQSDKVHAEVKNYDKSIKDKDSAYKKAEAKKLVALIGGKDGTEFKENYAKLGQFIGKHMPEFKKALDGGNFFPPSSVMKEIYDFQERLTKEDSLEKGGAAGGSNANGGGLFGLFMKDKTN